MLSVNIKKLNDKARIPSYAKAGDNGMDITATSVEVDYQTGLVTYYTGISLEIPEGYGGFLFPRSSIYKKDLLLTNSVGVIDSSYRGEIVIKFKLTMPPDSATVYKVGDRVAQLVILATPSILLKQVDSLTQTVRGSNGFGSSGE